MKPRITKGAGAWLCTGYGYAAIGMDPVGAYWNWRLFVKKAGLSSYSGPERRK